MNHLLLDTHAFIWFVLNDSPLSAAAKDIIGDSESRTSVINEFKLVNPARVM